MNELPKNIEKIDAWERMGDYSDKTYTYAPVGILKVKHGKKYVYFIPVGYDYNCEGGHDIYWISQEEFDKQYSLDKLE